MRRIGVTASALVVFGAFLAGCAAAPVAPSTTAAAERSHCQRFNGATERVIESASRPELTASTYANALETYASAIDDAAHMSASDFPEDKKLLDSAASAAMDLADAVRHEDTTATEAAMSTFLEGINAVGASCGWTEPMAWDERQ